MDREAWQATVPGVQRVGPDRVTTIYRSGGEVSLHSSTFVFLVLSLVPKRSKAVVFKIPLHLPGAHILNV